MNTISGIYKIVNIKNGKFYLGSSKNIKRRWYIHKSALKHNRHHCIHLQRSWNKHGSSSFTFEIIKEMPNATEPELLNEETKLTNELLPEYNIGSVGGGDNLTNNPNREEIIKRMTATLNARISTMTELERKEKWSKPKDKNPNWKGGVSSPTCNNCGKQLGYGHKYCSYCSKLGNRNPFYGKSHSEETIQYLKEINKGKLPTNIRSVVADGITYPSVAEAARQIGVCNATIIFRIKSKHWNYEYVTQQHPS
jgi:group I intron endonuclease